MSNEIGSVEWRQHGRTSAARSSPRKEVCRHFQRTGWCKYGDDCKYSHTLSDAISVDKTSASKDQTERKVRSEPCRFFQEKGWCKYGDECRFLHISKNENLPEASTPISNPFRLFEMIVHQKMVNASSKKIAQFVRVFEACLSGEDESIRCTVLQTLNSTDGVAILRNMFGSPKQFTVAETKNNLQVSLTGDLFPVVELLTGFLVLNTTLQNCVNGILRALGHCFDWNTLTPLLEELPTDRILQADMEWNSQRQDGKLMKLVSAFSAFLVELIKRFDREFLEEIKILAPILVKLSDGIFSASQSTRSVMQLKDSVLELTSTLAQKTGQADFAEKVAEKLQEKYKESKSKRRGFSIVSFEEPPGELRPGGPRHDNDHADIVAIRTAPTEEEVLCELSPYLPPNKAGSVVHLPIGSVSAHRDLHFRLLRHNLVADIHTAIISFKNMGGIKGLSKVDNKTNKKKKEGFRDVRTDIYRAAEVENIEVNQNSGVSYTVSFTNIEMLSNKNKEWKSSYWKKSRRLAHGSLASLCWETGEEKKLNLVFGVISERKVENLCGAKASIGFRCVPNPYDERMLELMKWSAIEKQESEIVLLQAGPSFFAYHPVLDALKTAPIPLRQYITQPPPEEKQEGEVQTVSLPNYTEGDGTYSLSFLHTEHSPTPGGLIQVKANNPDGFPLEEVIENSTLDRPQAEALKVALTQEVAVIQGPPGTGKTYLGIQIVRALLSFAYKPSPAVPANSAFLAEERPALSPILCVCFTNHALDQFLVGLLDAGIKGIVRVGGNSRCERLEDYNLRNLAKPTLGATGYHLRREQLPTIHKLLTSQISTFRKDNQSVKWSELSETAMVICPEFEESLKEKASVDKNGEANLEAAWKTWCRLYDGREAISLQPPRPVEVLLGLEDFWGLPPEEHHDLKDFWINLTKNDRSSAVKRLMEQYEGTLNKYRELQAQSDLVCLKRASVVGMTTTFVAKNQKLLAGLKPKVVILEEAAEVLEAHVLTCLSSQTEHLILIGDHFQLRPKVDQYMLQASSGSGFDLDVSLFERLVTQNNLPFATLQTQRRMRPEFSELIRSTVYPHLEDHSSVKKYPKNIPGMKRTLFFFDHDHREEGGDEGKSHRNDFEAHVAVELASYLLKQQCFNQEDIAVVTPYVGQLLLIRNLISKASIPVFLDPKDEELIIDLAEKRNRENEGSAESVDVDQVIQINKRLQNCLRLATIDNFQGEEAKVVILSLVRNNKEGHIGFLGEQNRINVLLSRAKEGMYILGNADSLLACKKSSMWKEVLDMMKAQDCVGPCLELKCQNHPDVISKIYDWQDFQRVASNGGCQLVCEAQRPCGHICRKQCHIVDRDHVQNDCNVLVTVGLPCGHVIPKTPCHEARNPNNIMCRILVNVIPDSCTYGHKHKVRCYLANKFRQDPLSCTTLVDIKMPGCGHSTKVKCSRKENALQTPTSCKEICGAILKCGHTCKANCGKCIDKTVKKHPDFQMAPDKRDLLEHIPCDSLCNKVLLCGHECKEACHQDREECSPCSQPCAIVCGHRPRGCRKKCSEPCVPCAEACLWKCPHQGKCELPCGAPCDRLPCDRRCEKYLSCGCQCPSLCGENCPTKDYCPVHGTEYVKNMEVDMIMFRKLQDMVDEDFNEDPLIVLGCGHAFLTSTLDGHMELLDFYKRDKFDRWVEPKVGDRFQQFDQRKGCIKCRKPVVNIRRYGRVINKTAIDVMDRAFYQKFERKMKTHNDRLGELSTSLQAAKGNIEACKKTQDQVESLADHYLKLVQFSERPPTAELYRKVRNHILGLRADGVTTEEVKHHLQQLPVSKPDQTRQCRAYVGYGLCMKHWISLQTEILKNLTRRTRYHDSDDKKFQEISACIDHGIEEILRSHDRLTLSLETASSSLSKTRIVDACRGSLQIHVESIKFTIEMLGIVVSKAKKVTVLEQEETVKTLQASILKKAQEVIETGLIYCTSEEQTAEILELSNEVDKMSQLLSETSEAMKMEILNAVLVADPRIQASNARGHLYRCPNGHYYIIGECGGAMQTGTCPDCGRGIGGQSHTLTQGNTRAREEDMRLLR